MVDIFSTATEKETMVKFMFKLVWKEPDLFQ